MVNAELYSGREQSAVKHEILQTYLFRLAVITGRFRNSLAYVDCFCGPWQEESTTFEDTSFNIAVTQLREAANTLKDSRRVPKYRCYFLERDKVAYQKLRSFAAQANDMEIRTRNSPFQDSVPDILDFVNAEKSFAFFFIDPTGWKSISMETIKPLLRYEPAEVLVNFMTSHIHRWMHDENQSFDELYGSSKYTKKLEGLVGQDLDDEMVFSYLDAISAEGPFPFVSSAVVLNPTSERAHFHLIYATRDLKGIEVFKEAERKAMRAMHELRADAKQRKRVDLHGQNELFGSTEMYKSKYFDSLHERYTTAARQEISTKLQTGVAVEYDELWRIAARYPLTYEADLKRWIKEWGCSVEGLRAEERVPKTKNNHRIALPRKKAAAVL
jgi:three-Cys-motif partner protein